MKEDDIQMKKDDIHICILRCVQENPEGITIRKIEEKLQKDAGELKWINEECDTGGKKFWRKGKDEHGQWIISLSMEGRAILLQHKELEQAKKSSKIATYIAIAALIVTILVRVFK